MTEKAFLSPKAADQTASQAELDAWRKQEASDTLVHSRIGRKSKLNSYLAELGLSSTITPTQETTPESPEDL